MNLLFKDTETFSTIPIDYGVYKYVEQAEVLLYPFAYNDEPVDLWDCTRNPMPYKLKQLLKIKNLPWVAHNSQFDRVILEKCLGITHYPWLDTMVIAYQHGLPGSLENLCKLFKLPENKAKQERGKKLIDLFGKPLPKNRKLRRATRLTHPKEWEEFKEYAVQDVAATREIYKLLPKWNCIKYEYKIWQLDQKINERGLKIDTELVDCAINAVDSYTSQSNDFLSYLTNGEITRGTQRDRLLKYIRNVCKIDIPDLQAHTVENYLQDKNTPLEVKTLLKIRQETTKSSTAKYIAIKNSLNSDNRIRGYLQYYGAAKTGRWAGRGIQPQNLPRPTRKNKVLTEAMKLLKAGKLKKDVSVLCSEMLRNTIIADECKKLIALDYSSIEGRTVNWLAGAQEKLDIYAKSDVGIIKYDMYMKAYADTFNIDPETVTKAQRQIGKPIELMLNYQGGVSALQKGAATYKLDLQEIADNVEIPEPYYSQAENWYHNDKCNTELPYDIFIALDGIKRIWRCNNPKIVQYWYDVENAAIQAIVTGCRTYVNNIEFDVKNNYLRLKLPSGRYLSYYNAQIIDNKIYYYHHKYGLVSNYGGELVENITQATARDVLVSGMFQAENAGYKIVLTVHDELVTEVPNNNKYTLKKLTELLKVLPDWCYGLPMPADGFEDYRYKKED